LGTAVRSSLRWYEDIFAVHGIPTAVEPGLWKALGEPPRWHSAAKTLSPTTAKDEALRAVEAFDHCSIADSFGALDLSDAGFGLLFEATWVHHPPLPRAPAALPEGWSVVTAGDELEAWNDAHDTPDVLLPSLLRNPRFRFLCQRAEGRLVAGAVLHDAAVDAVGLSNLWVVPLRSLDPAALLSCAAVLLPGRAVVGYEGGPDLGTLLDAGFVPVGPQRVWAR
jgi:hypothetical protein